MRDVLIGQTDYTVLVRITGADGAPETALAHTDIDIAYSRVETDNDVTTSDVAPADLANLTAAHSDWGWEEVSSTDHPGLYRLDIADAVFASGAWEAVVTITDASGSDFYAHDIGFRLVSVNWQDGVRLGLTALPNAAADGAGGLPISDAGGLDLDAQVGTKINDILTDTGTTLQGELDGIQADTEDIQSRLPAALTGDGNIKADTLRWGGTAVASANVLIDGAITAAKIASDAFSAAKFADGCLTAAKFASGAFDAVWGVAARVLTAATNITSTGGTTVPQTGDSFARIGAAGASLTDLGGMSTTMKSQVNAEVVDTLATDTYAEPGQGTPAATLSLAAKINYLFKSWRNKKTQTSSVWSLFNDDAATVDQKASVSDDATTATKGEIATGP